VIAVSGVLIIRYVYQMEGIMSDIIKEDLVSYQLAESLETSLVNQKGFVTYYYLDKNPVWLERLGEYRRIFQQQLKEIEKQVIRDCPSKSCRKDAVQHVRKVYDEYIRLKDRVIAHYVNGEQEEGAKLHSKVRDHFFATLKACESYKQLLKDDINSGWEKKHAKALKLITSVVIMAVVVFALITFLISILATRILNPLRLLAMEARRDPKQGPLKDDVISISKNVRDLIEDAGKTQTELDQSRDILIQSEKLALVGKLAAGTAHSIRNPLTSVKMRLFSLGKTLNLSESQKEDFDVISDEIRHLDTIVQNFLEFSRPPRLVLRQISLSTVVDQSLQLLKHRLNSYNVTARVHRQEQLPEIQADPEQLKEVFVNLIVNACEALQAGGEVVIHEDVSFDDSLIKRIVIKVSDNGPGIPAGILNEVLQPFFTTKEEGTGLGLSIASRIIEEHHGSIAVTSVPGKGTVITMNFPLNR